MIDWLTLPDIPCFHSEPINGGAVLSVDPDGVQEWATLKFRKIVASSDASIRIRTAHVDDKGRGTALSIDGNPTKFLQGHNLWGTDDLIGLVVAFMDKLAPLAGLRPTDIDRALWLKGAYSISRIDITTMFRLKSRDDVLAWIRQAEITATLPYRGRGQVSKGSTLYFGKHSRRSSLKFYPKGQEQEANGGQLVKGDKRLLEYADSALRAEFVMRSMELKRKYLHVAANWDTGHPSGILKGVLQRLHMDDYTMITPERIEGLRPAVRAVYELWKEGHDIRGMYPRPTFYRYRKQILEAIDVDISNVQPKTTPDNVVPLYRVLMAEPMTVPDWAKGTELYAEPKRA